MRSQSRKQSTKKDDSIGSVFDSLTDMIIPPVATNLLPDEHDHSSIHDRFIHVAGYSGMEATGEHDPVLAIVLLLSPSVMVNMIFTVQHELWSKSTILNSYDVSINSFGD